MPSDSCRQLRFALSMNGGVSLAVWIGGAVAEIDRIRRGDDAFWTSLLKGCGYQPKAQVDVMSGASAGGLNAVMMAQAIRADHKFDVFLPLWKRVADIDLLVKPPLRAIRQGTKREVLDGSMFLGELRKALDDLTPNGSLDHDLAVFASATLVTANNLWFRDTPGAAITESHSDAYFHIARRGPEQRGLDGFADQDQAMPTVEALARIGRATSSLPGLFEPVAFSDGTPGDGTNFGSRLVGAFEGRRTRAEIMDGGVIDNVPISRAIRAIANSRAEHRVHRVLLYLHPDPGGEPISTGEPNDPETGLRVVLSFFGKRKESIREDIDLLRAHNDAVRRRADTAAALIDGFISGTASHTSPDEMLRLARTATVATLLRAAVDPPSELSWHAPTVLRLGPLLDQRDSISKAKLVAALDQTVARCPDVLLGAQPRRIGLAIQRLVDTIDAAATGIDTGAVRRKLHNLLLFADIVTSYQLARFLGHPSGTDGTDHLQASHSELTATRIHTAAPGEAWKALANWQVDKLASLTGNQTVGEYLDRLVADTIACLPDCSIDEARGGHAARLVEQLRMNEMTPDQLDRLMLPLAAEPVASDQAIEFIRVAGNVTTPASEAFDDDQHKIAGRQLHHLGAFFKETWRDNDWRWGRLDSVPGLIDAILDDEALEHLRHSDEFTTLLGGVKRNPTDDELKRDLIAKRQVQILNELLPVAATTITDIAKQEAFQTWQREDRRITSLIGSRSLTSTAIRGVITASKVFRHGATWWVQVMITVLRPLLLAAAGITLAGRRAAATLAWTLSVMAAVRAGTTTRSWVWWSVGAVATVVVAWLVEQKIKPTGSHRWAYPQYALAVAGLGFGIWAIGHKSWLHTHQLPLLGWSAWWPIPPLAAAISAAMLFYWMRWWSGALFVAATALMYGVVSYAAQRLAAGDPLQRWPTWWPLHSLWVCWIVAVLGFPIIVGFLPETMLKPADRTRRQTARLVPKARTGRATTHASGRQLQTDVSIASWRTSMSYRMTQQETAMTAVTRIDWTIQTGDAWWSGTDGTVKIEILRDGGLIKRLNLEPGHTPRLDRNEWATYYWVFASPDGLGVAVSGTAVPYTESFPKGVRGHLQVRFIAQSDDAWEALEIDSSVHSGFLRHIPGTIDAVEWRETIEDFRFPGRDVLSTDRSEGVTMLTLNY